MIVIFRHGNESICTNTLPLPTCMFYNLSIHAFFHFALFFSSNFLRKYILFLHTRCILLKIIKECMKRKRFGYYMLKLSISIAIRLNCTFAVTTTFQCRCFEIDILRAFDILRITRSTTSLPTLPTIPLRRAS